MALVTAPRNGIPIGIARFGGQQVTVEVHPEYLRFFESMTVRVGGTTGSGTDDLTLSQFEDAGIEENKAAVYRLTDDVFQMPPMVETAPAVDNTETTIEALRAEIAELKKAIQALQQGTTA